jgi:F-type H+-transporting ATPase subunit epsilon
MLSQRDTVGGGTTQEWHVEIVTPEGETLHPQATLVELSTPDGQIGVMPGHEGLVTVLEEGELVIHNGRQRDVYLVGGGFARVQAERLSVLAFSLDRATDSPALEKCRARRRELLADDENDPPFDPNE